ncbi:hypothetical protein KIN20_010212, partial [Parelaphostrongylus tenuis]
MGATSWYSEQNQINLPVMSSLLLVTAMSASSTTEKGTFHNQSSFYQLRKLLRVPAGPSRKVHVDSDNCGVVWIANFFSFVITTSNMRAAAVKRIGS